MAKIKLMIAIIGIWLFVSAWLYFGAKFIWVVLNA
jgi:hypothetical protein